MALLSRLVRAAVRPLQDSASSLDGAADVIVVLGAPIAPTGELGRSAHERIEAGVRAFHAGAAPWLLVTGGRSDPSLFADLRAGLFGSAARARGGASEAEAMRRHALARGVADARILVEDRARSTDENAHYSARIMRERGLARALVVTQPYHLRRSLALFAREGIAAAPLLLDDSHIFAGGASSLRAMRWITREYVILAGVHLLARGPRTSVARR